MGIWDICETGVHTYSRARGVQGVRRKEIKMLEREVEQHLITQVKKHGGLCLKFTSPGTRGVPDRIVIYDGEVFFTELKRPGGKLRKDQEKMKEVFNKQGIPVFVLSKKEQVNKFVKVFVKNGLNQVEDQYYLS